MIKKIISIILCTFMIFSLLSVNADSTITNYENVKIEYTRADSTIAVSGNVKSVIDNTELVRLMVLKPNCDVDKLSKGEISFKDWAVYADETVLTNKAFTFDTFKLANNIPLGDYILRIAYNGEVYTKTIPVATVAETIDKIKYATDAAVVKKCVESYNDVYGLDIDEGSIFESFSAEDKNWVYTKMLGADIKASIQNAGDVKKHFTNFTCLKKITLGPWGAIDGIITNPAITASLGLDLTQYNSLSPDNKDNVCKALPGTEYSTPAALNSRLNELSLNPPVSDTTVTIVGGSVGGTNKKPAVTSDISWVGENVNVPDADDTEKVAFSDLGNHQWAVESINKLYAKGIVNGKSEGVFAPEDNLTRAEAVKLIVLAFGGVDTAADCEFADVDENSWMYTYIATAYKRGIINGYSDGTAGANDNITREDFSVMITRAAEAAEINLYEKNDAVSFSDETDISDYAKLSVSKLQMAGIINGMEDNTFMPKAPTTRAQAAKIIAGLV